MDEIEFDSKEINDYFKKGKEKLYLKDIEDASFMRRGKDEKLTQHDLDLLMNCREVFLINYNLDGLTFNKGRVKRLSIKTKGNVNSKKIIEDYPNYNDLEPEERYKIIADKKYAVYPELNISGISNLTDMEQLSILGFSVSKDLIEELGNLEKIKNLRITGQIEPDTVIPKLERLEQLELEDVSDFDLIKNLTNIKDLAIYQTDIEETKNIELLREFNKLEQLTIYGIDGIDNYLPDAELLSLLSLNKCNISDISFINNYSNLKRVVLGKNNIGMDNKSALEELHNKVETLNFDENPISDELKDQKIDIEDEETRTEIAKLFGAKEPDNFNEYDLLKKEPSFNNDIESVEILNTLVAKGIIDKLDFDTICINGFEGLTQQAIEWIARTENLSIEINSFRGINQEILDKLSKNSSIHFLVKNDLYASLSSYRQDINMFYTLEDIKEIYSVIEQIKSKIPENASDITKFKIVYEEIGKRVDYDHSGCQNSEEYISGMEKVTRSLKGVLVEGRAVCLGYARALECCLDYVGIEAKSIGGFAYNDPHLCHKWNQVKIDGIWYNTDLTWDYKKIRTGEELKYCLKSDKEFYKDHTPDPSEKVQECNQDYDFKKQEKINGNNIEDKIKKEAEVTIEEFKENAENTRIHPDLVKKIEAATRNKEERTGDINERE